MEGMWAEKTAYKDQRAGWTPEREAITKKKWSQDKTTQQIADYLGVSRNTVVGKLKRLGLLGARRAKWTPAREKLLTDLWSTSLSQEKIATRVGITRQALAEKAQRLGLPPRAKRRSPGFGAQRPSNPIPKKQQRRRFDFTKIFAAIDSTWLDHIQPVEQRKTLLELQPHHCRWPIGDPQLPDFFFCAADKADGFSYCAGHLRASIQPRSASCQ